MRVLTKIAAISIVLITAGSIYLYIDTKRFIENLSETQKQSVSQKGSAAVGPPSPEKEGSAPTADTSDTPSRVPTEQENETHAYDWREDKTDHGHTQVHGDPWQQNQPIGENSHWSEITDPYERAKVFRSELREEFGDAPEVDALVEGFLKVWTQKTMDADERSQFFKAYVTLRPDSVEKTESLETRHTHLRPSQPFLNLRHQFSDIEPFVAEYGFEEGILIFSAQNPERALEFKRALWQTDEVQSSLENLPEEARNFFKEIAP